MSELVDRLDTSKGDCRLTVVAKHLNPAGGLPPLRVVERMYIEAVLERCEGNKMRAAKILGIDRRTLYRYLERWEKQR